MWATLAPILLPMVLALITKLGPTIGEDVINYFLSLIPTKDDPHAYFVKVCVAITNGVYQNPGVKIEDKKRYSVDACLYYARSMGIKLDQGTLDLLGLKISDATVS